MGCNCFNPCSSVAASIPICIRTSRLHDLTTIGPPNFWRQVLNSYSKDSNPENMTTPNHHFVYNSDVISIISTGVYSHMCWWVPTHISTGWYDSERSYQFQWLSNYLSDRFQWVVLNGTCTSWLPVTSGVPQGSIWGPLLFLLYVNDILNVSFTKNSPLVMYADDLLLFKPISKRSFNFSMWCESYFRVAFPQAGETWPMQNCTDSVT